MDESLLNFIIILHFLFVVFIIITPFIGNNYFLILHSAIVPFLLAHWYTNNNNCALTIIEKHIRYKMYGTKPDPDDCFMHRLVAPVYDFKKNNDDISGFLYIATTLLWLYTIYKLHSNYKEGRLATVEDIFIW